MAILKCKMCGGDLNVAEGATVCECEYCGSKQTVPTADNEKKMALFARANRLRFGSEFDKAAGVYEAIVADYPEEAEAYWGLVLCKYGIEYVDDPATGNKIPTCHRSSFDSVMEDSNFDLVMEYADPVACAVYREEAKRIENLRRGIIAVSSQEEPYDIFICYKETDSNGERTIDSVIAQDVYTALTEKGYRVFFSRISLEDKLGAEYEPYIFAALQSARVMLAFGTDYTHYNAVWVKNEWSRFLQLVEKGEKKTLIPCYKNIDAYDIPKEFAKLQAQDMGKVGAMQDLLRGIDKILRVEKAVAGSTMSPATALLKRGFMSLEDGDWVRADSFCEQALNLNPECGEAYLAKLMLELRVRTREELKDCARSFEGYSNYQKAIRFGDGELREELQRYVQCIRNRNSRIVYDAAVQAMEAADTEWAYKQAAEQFEQIHNYEDSAELAHQCRTKAETARTEALYRHSVELMEEPDIGKIQKAMHGFQFLGEWEDSPQRLEQCRRKILAWQEQRQEELYQQSVEMMDQHTENSLEQAMNQFASISAYKDAAKLAELCRERLLALRSERAAAEQSERRSQRKRRRRRRIEGAVIAAVLLLGLFVVYPLFCYSMGDYGVVVKMYYVREYTVPSGVKEIHDETFRDCESLEKVKLPDSLTSIGDYAFTDCVNLRSVDLPEDLITLGTWAFSGCKELENITIPAKVYSVGAYAFRDCTKLESVDIKEGVTAIKEGAFYDCESLEKITIPASVTSIESMAFDGCTAIKVVTYGGTVAQWQEFNIWFDNGNVLVKCTDGSLRNVIPTN